MVEGDEWKRQIGEWNTPEKIALDEYTSMIHAHYEHVLRPIVQRGEKLDRDVLEIAKSDLEWKINDSDFKKLSLKTRRAYQAFRKFVETLKNSSDKEIKANQKILYGLFKLGIDCPTYGSFGHDKGRNPCREDQYEMFSAIKKAERVGKGLDLIEAVKDMFDVCKKCPYK